MGNVTVRCLVGCFLSFRWPQAPSWSQCCSHELPARVKETREGVHVCVNDWEGKVGAQKKKKKIKRRKEKKCCA